MFVIYIYRSSVAFQVIAGSRMMQQDVTEFSLTRILSSNSFIIDKCSETNKPHRASRRARHLTLHRLEINRSSQGIYHSIQTMTDSGLRFLFWPWGAVMTLAIFVPLPSCHVIDLGAPENVVYAADTLVLNRWHEAFRRAAASNKG